MTLPKWTPFHPATPIAKTDAEIAELARIAQLTEDAVRAQLAFGAENYTIFMNSRYQVQVGKPKELPGWPPIIHLSIKRLDKEQVGTEHFRDFQRIKNELVGEEYEAVEIYPAESRLADSANQYHLWVLADPEARFPFGFGERLVGYESGGGAKQAPLEA